MKHPLHIIAFNTPWPANYGGVIDVYHKIRALHAVGVEVILHCFEYGRDHANQLKKVCSEVHYYTRHTGLIPNLSLIPYNVNSRRSHLLLQDLLVDNAPILFEGLHSCYLLNHPALADRFKIVRCCNIEHNYYRALAEVESNFIYRNFFNLEAYRFERFEPQLHHAQLIYTVSTAEEKDLKQRYPDLNIQFIPCFHAYDDLSILPGQSDYVLYHGKLSVGENEKAALYLISNVFSHLKSPCIIAGMDPSCRLLKATAPYSNIQIIANPNDAEMQRLITNAQVHALITFQNTGLKLKLLNSLFAGRHILVNKTMLTGSGLDKLCHIANTPEMMIKICEKLLHTPFDPKEIHQRRKLLFPTFSNLSQAQNIKEQLI
ncbi:MAG: glycosyltransferase family 1 protein [Massilibacteroides sp.]|nr:glycosyltransferase family 1 protein [Massilibacteroides sp.]